MCMSNIVKTLVCLEVILPTSQPFEYRRCKPITEVTHTPIPSWHENSLFPIINHFHASLCNSSALQAVFVRVCLAYMSAVDSRCSEVTLDSPGNDV